MGKIISIIVLVFLSVTASATLQASGPRLPSDSSVLESRRFDQDALARYKTQKAFQYGADYQTAESLWDRFWRWFWNNLGSAVTDATSNNVVRNISIFLMVGLIIFLIIKFSGVSITQLFTGKATTAVVPYSESKENIHEIHFEEEIQKAIHNMDYRLAVRMLYLKCLKKLSDEGLIAWQIDKTNSAYIAELDNSGKKEKFTFLTRQFEYIWYGEFNIDQSAFHKVYADFKEFNKSLS